MEQITHQKKSIKKSILLIGNGWSGATFLANIDYSKYDVTNISQSDQFTYTPLLAAKCVRNIVVQTTLDNTKYSFVKANVTGINIENKTLSLEMLPKNNDMSYYVHHNVSYDISKYDYIVFSQGSTTNTFNINGVNEFCKFLKSNSDAEKIRNWLDDYQSDCHVIVIGCGPTGVELVGEILDYKVNNPASNVSVTAIDALKRPLPSFDETVSEFIFRIWKNNLVSTYFGSGVKTISDDDIMLSNNTLIPYDKRKTLLVWCGGIKSSDLTCNLVHDLVSCDANSKGILVDDNMKVVNSQLPNVYAIGDCSYSSKQYPPTAQVSIQQGKYLAKIFNSEFKNKEEFNFESMGQMVYLGKGYNAYQSKYIGGSYIGGYLTKQIRLLFHVYHAVTYDQKKKIYKSL